MFVVVIYTIDIVAYFPQKINTLSGFLSLYPEKPSFSRLHPCIKPPNRIHLPTIGSNCTYKGTKKEEDESLPPLNRSSNYSTGITVMLAVLSGIAVCSVEISTSPAAILANMVL